MKCLTRDELLKPKIKTKWVPLPSWGEGQGVYVRTLSGKDRDAFEVSQMGDDDTVKMKNFRARFVALTASDEKGNRIFSDADAAQLGEQECETLIEIFNEARKLNQLMLTKDEAEQAEKNSEIALPVA